MKQKYHTRGLHLKRLSLFFVLLLAFFIVRIDSVSVSRPAKSSVLAYATNMSRDGLLTGTNAARAANGLGALLPNSQLNSSAQAKAQHMADNNYWAHVAPDGTQPWYFFNQAGYDYIRAGENLAYGFGDSQGAVDGWMNSPSHRANILGSYVDVGFGIVNVPNYQNNGEQTIVVAHYGAPAVSAPVAQAAPAAPAPAAPSAPATSSPTPAAPAESPSPVESAPLATKNDTAVPDKVTTPATASPKAAEPTAPVATGDISQVSVLSLISAWRLPLAALVSLLLVGFAATGYALTHRIAFRQAVHAGEHFVVAHPGVDTAIIAAFASLILLTTYGNIG